TYSTKNIQTVGLSSIYISAFDVSQIEMKISGPEEVLGHLSEENVHALVDLRGAVVGSREYEVQVSLPEDCELVEKPRVSVTVSRMKSTESGRAS
ncbi:MAG: CdaR family protein, partial [bacterium]